MESAQDKGLIDLIKEWFSYDPALGIVSRLKKERSDALDDIPPHWPNIRFKGKSYSYAVICWVLYYHEFPKGWIDHKDRIHANHTINNLRVVTPTQNQQNKAGCGQYAKGVTWRDRKIKPWQAKIRVNGTRLHLGSYETEEEAAAAYREAAYEHHGEFACVE